MRLFWDPWTQVSPTTAGPRTPRTRLTSGCFHASQRSEEKRGEWKRFEQAGFRIRAVGSVAYKLALVAAGLADATFTLTPKHEWGIAAGAALVLSAGGFVSTLDDSELRCNNKNPLLSGLFACGPNLREQLVTLVHNVN